MDEDHPKLLGTPILFEEAVEPSNIIWENTHFTTKQQTIRKVIVTFLVALVLLGAFALFAFLKIKAVRNQRKYPPGTNCDDIDVMFNN